MIEDTVSRRGFLTISTSGLLLPLSGCTEGDDFDQGSSETTTSGPTRRTVVESGDYDRTVNYFQAEKGDAIEVYVRNGEGFRTHALVNGPDNEIVLSEGVQDEARFRLVLDSTGEYKVTMTPSDDSQSTNGFLRVILEESNSSPDTSGNSSNTGVTPGSGSSDNPSSVVGEWVSAQEDRIRTAQSTFEDALDTYESGQYEASEAGFTDAEGVFEELLNEAARNANDHPRESDLYQLYGAVSYYFSKMRDSSTYYTYTARLRHSDSSRLSAQGKDGDADFWESEGEDSYETAQDARQEANGELSGIEL